MGESSQRSRMHNYLPNQPCKEWLTLKNTIIEILNGWLLSMTYNGFIGTSKSNPFITKSTSLDTWNHRLPFLIFVNAKTYSYYYITIITRTLIIVTTIMDGVKKNPRERNFPYSLEFSSSVVLFSNEIPFLPSPSLPYLSLSLFLDIIHGYSISYNGTRSTVKLLIWLPMVEKKAYVQGKESTQESSHGGLGSGCAVDARCSRFHWGATRQDGEEDEVWKNSGLG